MKKYIFSLFFLFAGLASAQDKATVSSQPSLSQYLNIRVTGTPQLSPNGSEYVFLWSITGTPQVWKSKTAGGFPEQLTFFEDRIQSVLWSPAGDKVLFSKDAGGDEKTQIFSMNPDGSEIKQLTPNPKAIYDLSGISRDGKLIAYRSNERKESVFDVYVMAVQSGQTTRITEDDISYMPGHFSPDGKFLIVSKGSTSLNNDLYLLELATQKLTLLTPHEGDAVFLAGDWTPDSKQFYLVTNKNKNYNTLALMTIGNSQADFTTIDLGNYDVEDADLSKDGTYLSCTINQDGYSRTSVKNLKTGKLISLPNGKEVTAVTFTQDSKKFLVTYASGAKLPERYLYDPNSKKLSQISFGSYAGVPKNSFVEPQLVTYKSFDGTAIPAFLYVPQGAMPTKSLPMIISYHGGPEDQSRPYFNPLTQYFVSRGYAVLQPNVRGSSGYGKDYLNADNSTKREVSLKDGIAAADWAKTSGWADPNKLIAYGGSYGGYMTLAMVTFYPDYWAAGVDVVGISNMLSFLKNTGAFRQKNRIAEYGDPDRDSVFLKKISPLFSVSQIKAPLMVIQGANDPRVPQSEADQIVAAIKAKNGVVEYQLFPDEGHGLAKLKNRITGYTKVVDFLDKYVKSK
jgi:dipeptidyl aminopeptidase/acylaminoacyl peptidase